MGKSADLMSRDHQNHRNLADALGCAVFRVEQFKGGNLKCC